MRVLVPEHELKRWLRGARRGPRKAGATRLPQLGDAPRRLLEPYLRSDVALMQWTHAHRVVETAETARELYDQMLDLYPERVNPGMLWWSARTLKPS